jgi:DNA end-binding protein Ku
VTLHDKEIPEALADSTHAVDILAFIEAQGISALYFETPYYLAPVPGGEKVYAMLREALRRTRKIGIAYVVIQARQHLAALIPDGQSLVLNTLRWTCATGAAGNASPPAEDHDKTFLTARARRPGVPRVGSHQWKLAHQDAFQPDVTVLAEHNMKAKKIEEILVEELEGLLEDDELSDDEYLASILRLHSPDAYGMRRGRLRHGRQHHSPRTRMRTRGAGQ